MISDELLERIRAFQESRVILTAIELDLFVAVGQGATAAEVAARQGSDPRATEMLLNALTAIELLEKRGGRFFTTRVSASLVERDVRLAMLHQVGLWQRWSTLTDAVRAGGAVARGERSAAWTEAFIAAMDYNARSRAGVVVRAVDAARVRRMLDIGGGSGAYSIAFAQANPGLRSVILDVPAVIEIARRHIQTAGVPDRVEARAGDLHSGDFGVGYDLVFVSAICHMLSPEENLKLLQDSFRALEPGGRVAIQDFILERDKTAPRAAALFALNMLVGTERGSSYSEEEYAGWLKEAGFGEIRRVRLPGPTGLMVGTR